VNPVTGNLPAVPLPSEQVILAAPWSWAGSTRRIWRRWHPAVLTSSGWGKAGRVTGLWSLLVLAWLGVAVWYALLAGIGLLPLAVLIVYRIVRRSQRRGRRNALRHSEIIGR
jgi:hypothetical protein